MGGARHEVQERDRTHHGILLHVICSAGWVLDGDIFDVTKCEAAAQFVDSGSIGNAVTIFVIIRTRRLYNPCTPFLVNISVADLSTTLFILPVLGFNALAGVYLIPFPVCKFFSVSFHTGIGITQSNFPRRIDKMQRNFSTSHLMDGTGGPERRKVSGSLVFQRRTVAVVDSSTNRVLVADSQHPPGRSDIR